MSDAPERTGYEGDSIEVLLARLSEVGNMEKASFGFPNDRVRIVSRHMDSGAKPDPFTGLTVGHDIHPDDYVRQTTRLYRQSWFDPLVKELHRRYILSTMVEARRIESAHLRTEITQARADLETLKRLSRETELAKAANEGIIAALREERDKLLNVMEAEKAKLEDDIECLKNKKAILQGELPTEIKASKRSLEL